MREILGPNAIFFGLSPSKEDTDESAVGKDHSVNLTDRLEGFSAIPNDPECAAQMEASRRGMCKYHNALGELARK